MMAKNPLVAAHNSAVRMNATIGDFMARTGSSTHPRGFVTTAYRNARRALQSALQENDSRPAARDVFAGLKATVRSAALAQLLEAQQAGMNESVKQLALYGVDGGVPYQTQHSYDVANGAADAIIAKIDEQEKLCDLMLLTGATHEKIIGDENRVGVLRASDVAVTVGTWAAVCLWDAFSAWTNSRASVVRGYAYQKQVVAALDARTTDCCLKAHGQIQPMDQAFHLTGTPRFADYVDWTPFHWNCRTSIALYLPGYDGGITEAMRESARIIMAERAAGGSGDRDPANAYSST